MSDLQHHYSRKQRRAMEIMARSFGIEPAKYPDNRVLWGIVSEAMAGGVKRTQDPVVGDPFAVFLTGICTDMHEGKGWHKQTVVVKTGEMVDQAEGDKIIAYLKAQDNVKICEGCGKKIDTWQTDNTRISTFAAQETTMIRGSSK